MQAGVRYKTEGNQYGYCSCHTYTRNGCHDVNNDGYDSVCCDACDACYGARHDVYCGVRDGYLPVRKN